MMGSHVIRTWSTTQYVIATSSGEAEYYATVKMGSQLLGTKSMLADLGITVKLKILTDASAAQGIAARRGLGQVRHIEVSTLWLQDQVNKGIIQIEKVKGTENLADSMTKHTGETDHEVFHKWY